MRDVKKPPARVSYTVTGSERKETLKANVKQALCRHYKNHFSLITLVVKTFVGLPAHLIS